LFNVDNLNLGHLWVGIAYNEDMGGRIHGVTWGIYSQLLLMYGLLPMLAINLFMSLGIARIIRFLLVRNSILSVFIAAQILLKLYINVIAGTNIDAVITGILYSISYNLILLFVIHVIHGSIINRQ